MPNASAGVAATSQESETYLPCGSLISPGFFRSVLVMLVGSYESAQNLCRGLEQGFGPRIFHLAHVLAQVVPDVAQHSPYLDRVVTRIALRVPLLVLTHKILLPTVICVSFMCSALFGPGSTQTIRRRAGRLLQVFPAPQRGGSPRARLRASSPPVFAQSPRGSCRSRARLPRRR